MHGSILTILLNVMLFTHYLERNRLFLISIFLLLETGPLFGGQPNVNIRTLNLFLSEDQLSLPCYQPIEIKGAYNSYSDDASIFGYKWTFNHNISIKKEKSKFKVIEGDGFANEYTRERNLDEAKKELTENIIIAKKKIDSQNGGLKAQTVYDEFKQHLLADASFRDEQDAKLVHSSRPLGPGLYYSFARGPSVLEMKPDGSFVRTFDNGAYEVFGKDGKILKSVDRNDFFISYVYQGDSIVRINDMCGRYVSLSYKTDKNLKGLIDKITDSIGREIKYEFFPDRKLKSFVKWNKQKTEYTYDKVGDILSISHSKGAAPVKAPVKTAAKKVAPVATSDIHFKYNTKYEIEQQSGPGPVVLDFKRTFVGNNQNHSITEVAKTIEGTLDSKEVHEYKVKEYELKTTFDPLGKQVAQETKKFSPTTGYPVSILDEKGAGELYEYDAANGNILKKTTLPDNEVMQMTYDKKCNFVNSMNLAVPNRPVRQGLYTFDNRCNLLTANEMAGPEKKVGLTLQYNDQHRVSFITDDVTKSVIAFTWWKYGKPESITLKDTGSLLVKYAPDGEISQINTFPNGKGELRFKKTTPKITQDTIITEVKSKLDSAINDLKRAGLNIGI